MSKGKKSTQTAAQTQSEEAIAIVANDAAYPTAKPHWSFEITTIVDKPLSEVIAKLAGLDNFEIYSRLNPICVDYEEVERDWVVLPRGIQGLSEARVREFKSPSSSQAQGDDLDVMAPMGSAEEGKKYQRLKFTSKDKMSILWGLLSDIVGQRGTYVWDEETKTGLLETVNTSKPGIDIWSRKVIRFEEEELDAGKTKVVEFVEGYCPEPLPILERVAKSYARGIHK